MSYPYKMLISRVTNEFIDNFPTSNLLIGVTSEEYARLNATLEEYSNIKDFEEKTGVNCLNCARAVIAEQKGAYVLIKKWGKVYFEPDLSFYHNEDKGLVLVDSFGKIHELKDYGETWALTRKELEK